MTNSKLTKFEKLQQLQNKYTAELPAKIQLLQNYWQQLQASYDDDVLREFSRGAHNLAGSAGTFGFSELSKQARILEKTLNTLKSNAIFDDAIKDKISSALIDIHTVATSGSDFTYSPQGATHSEDVSLKVRDRLVYVVEDDPAIAEEIGTHLLHFGCKVEVFPNSSLATDALNEKLPCAMVIDVFLPEGDLAGPQFVSHAVTQLAVDVPVIFVSSRNDWEARLAAVRAGGDAYLRKPIDYGELLDQLDELIAGQETESFRILIVDDMKLLADHYALVLRDKGMQVEVLTDPTRLLDVLKEFKPELILMDIFMPGCSGLEAAKIIRQMDNLAGIPIIFLSTESDKLQQNAAMKIGADDFLEKPVKDDRLVTAVTLRVERFRKLRALMFHDSLTGLLNHVTIKLQLEGEVARSQRQKSPLVFAMIDIDHFKQVNDEYGHPMGDRVIKSLSRLLIQRLRKSDLVGRYGGEEFALVLSETKLEDAYRFINTLREQFEALVHIHQNTQFTCTFSAGLALLKSSDDANSLIRTADDALYRAKKGGRNQLVCAD